MQGEIIYLFAFDVANEINTHSLKAAFADKLTPTEIRIDHTVPRDVPLYQPLAIEPPACDAKLLGRDVKILVRVFEVGVVNVVMRVPAQATSLADLRRYHNPKTDGGQTFAELARQLCLQTCDRIRGSLIRSGEPSEPEAYTVFCLTELDGASDVNSWFAQQRREIAGLLAETDAALLSDAQIDESLRISRSFTSEDLVVIDWDASLVVELDGYAEDVLYVLEMANLQLEEFRVMDRRLDQHLETAYKDLERDRSLLFGAPTKMVNWLRRFRVDTAKLTDEVTHITKFLGDWHLARIYLGAAERFHLQQWRQSVDQRLSQLDQLYSVLQSENYERRMLWLEIAVVICFVVDLLAIFFWKH